MISLSNRRPATWAGVVSCLALLACPGNKTPPDAGGPQGPLALMEQEPNDRPDLAQRISQDTEISGTLSADPSKPDSDVYALGAPQLRLASVSLSGIPGVNVTLEVIDRDRNVLLMANGAGDGLGERIPNLKVVGDTWIRVAANRKGAGGAYTLKINFVEPMAGTELEPNERAVDASPLGLLPADEGLRVTGLIGHPADEDWYRVDLVATAMPPPGAPTPGTAPGTPDAAAPDAASAAAPPVPDAGPPDAGADAVALAVAAEVDAGPGVDEPRTALHIEVSAVPGVRLEVSVLSAAEAPLFTTKGKEGEALTVRNVGVRESDASVYVVVKSGWGGTGKDAKRAASPDTPYTLTVSREVAGATAEYEPNDDLHKATPLARGSYREAFLSPKGDVDYYVIRAEEPGLTQLQLSGVERLDLVLSVVRPGADGGTEATLLTSNDGLVKEPEVLNSVKCAPECFVKVQGAVRKVDGQNVRDYENAEQGYRLSANPIAEGGGGEVEPNNTPDLANPLIVGKPVRGTIHPKKDSDSFRLDLSERPVKTPITATVTGILKVDVGLYLYALDEDGKAELVQTADRAKGDTPETIRFSAEPGVYLLVVKDAKNRESNFQDSYQLTVTEGE